MFVSNTKKKHSQIPFCLLMIFGVFLLDYCVTPITIKDILKNKTLINDGLGYYGIPYNAIKLFVRTCPLGSLMS